MMCRQKLFVLSKSGVGIAPTLAGWSRAAVAKQESWSSSIMVPTDDDGEADIVQCLRSAGTATATERGRVRVLPSSGKSSGFLAPKRNAKKILGTGPAGSISTTATSLTPPSFRRCYSWTKHSAGLLLSYIVPQEHTVV